MNSMFENLFLPFTKVYNISEKDISYKKCGLTFSCNKKLEDGFFWFYSEKNLFTLAVYDIKTQKNFSFKYNHPDFFTIGMYNKPTSQYILDNSRTSSYILAYTRPKDTFSANFKKGDRNAGSSITFSKKFLYELSSEFNIDYKDFINIIFNPLIQLKIPNIEFVFKQIFNADPLEQYAGMYYKGKIIELLSLIFQYKSEKINQNTCSIISPNDNKTLENIIAYIHENYNTQITIKTLENIAYMGKNKLSRIFKLKYGITIMNYLSNVRIEQAKILLIDHSLSILSISNMVGYKNQGSFTDKFKELTGHTPSQYRKYLQS